MKVAYRNSHEVLDVLWINYFKTKDLRLFIFAKILELTDPLCCRLEKALSRGKPEGKSQFSRDFKDLPF